MPKPDLSNVRKFTPAERDEWKRYGGKKPPSPPRDKKRKKRNKQGTRMGGGRKVVVACISIRPELKIQAERWIGGGNFSKAVSVALNKMLMEMTDDAARINQAENRRRAIDDERNRVPHSPGRPGQGGHRGLNPPRRANADKGRRAARA